MRAELKSTPSAFYLRNLNLLNDPQEAAPLSGALRGCLGSLDGACIEKLLLHCASALESNDVTLAQQVMWVLNNVASYTGDQNQRLTAWFLRALISRASRLCPTAVGFNGTTSTIPRRLMSVTELAVYVDLIPWHRFGFCASNGAIYKAVEGYSKVHILDFSITHCMQWPTLIDALAKRPEGPPSLKITVPNFRPPVPPLLNVSIDEVGLRLGNFAKFRDVPFEFDVVEYDSSYSIAGDNNESSRFPFQMLLDQLSSFSFDPRNGEALVVNCQNWLRYLCDEPNDPSGQSGDDSSVRDAFLEFIKALDPCIVTVVDEDSDLSAPNLTSRITTCFNYLWIPFDALETFLPKDSGQRMEYESDIGHKIENILGFEGFRRLERLESGAQLTNRMRNIGFLSSPFCDDTVSEVKSLLDEHACGWGMKRDEDMLVLTWKGHNSVFATAWVPGRFDD